MATKVIDLVPDLKAQVKKAINKTAQGEEVWFVLIPDIAPTENGPAPAWGLSLWVRSPVIGEWVQTTAIQPFAPGIDQGFMDELVRRLMDQMMEARSKALSEIPEAPPADGLILPGQG